MWLRLSKRGCRFYNLHDFLVKHRIHKESAFNANGNHNHIDRLREYHQSTNFI